MKRTIAFILIFSAMLIWGTSFLVMKNALDSISAGFMIFTRGIIAFVVLFPLAFKGIKEFKVKDYMFVLFTGSVVASAYLTQAIGLKYTTPGKSAFLENAYCVVVPILTCILLKKKPTILNIACIILCVAGVVLISAESLTSTINIGDVLSIIAGVLFGVNITMTGLYAKKYNPISYTCGQFAVISLISGVYTLIFDRNISSSFDFSTILRILYLGIVVTAVAWVFRNYGQRILSPITISIILPFSAVVGTIISVIFKEDTLTTFFVAGGVLITLAILLDSLLPLYFTKKCKN